MKHQAFTHEHPRKMLSLRTRTRAFGTLNIAVALGGRSCGWGSCEKPRRTFIGSVRRGKREGLHFVELVVSNALDQRRTLFRFGDRFPEPQDLGSVSPE